jgi:sugar (pentulose or hexulose) kinase
VFICVHPWLIWVSFFWGEALWEAVTSAKEDPPVALALSVQGEAVVPVDRNGRALRPAILQLCPALRSLQSKL